ncbi:2'-5' RNA ligase family protein [Fulvivirgaceae bacterium PWU5]|uniref:2'-5' RNA ligase family protein n=1 Tax=Dawidia cretensis TaxID=2782350 RepID=A0AAP2DY92_9BACT|nr:2'-5' RNA ligase family protein [Dawidia cretensis]MBT1708624.1 2'-5' RNA ligase family protein [Dawidia cretensis]
MKLTTKTGSIVKELSFIISPPPHIRSDVFVLKDDVHYLLGHPFPGRYSTAHISLFKYKDEHLEDMIRYVEAKAVYMTPFNIFVKNLAAFHHGNHHRTIYLDIINKYPVRDIFEKLVREDSHYTPHITIAPMLSLQDFDKCWPHLQDLRYSQHFLCDRITVLARGDGHWMHYRDIMLGED